MDAYINTVFGAAKGLVEVRIPRHVEVELANGRGSSPYRAELVTWSRSNESRVERRKLSMSVSSCSCFSLSKLSSRSSPRISLKLSSIFKSVCAVAM